MVVPVVPHPTFQFRSIPSQERIVAPVEVSPRNRPLSPVSTLWTTLFSRKLPKTRMYVRKSCAYCYKCPNSKSFRPTPSFFCAISPIRSFWTRSVKMKPAPLFNIEIQKNDKKGKNAKAEEYQKRVRFHLSNMDTMLVEKGTPYRQFA